MKRSVVHALTLLFVLFLTNTPAPTQAAEPTIYITAPSHRELNDIFLDDQLAADLSPAGAIGGLLFVKNSQEKKWSVDPALVEEITVMAKGYKLLNHLPGIGQDFAQNFLTRLTQLASAGQVEAMVYGNPSEYWVKRLTPHERNYLLVASQRRLSELLKSEISAPQNYLSNKYFSLNRQNVLDITNDYSTIQSSAIYMSPADLDKDRLSLTRLFNPAMSSRARSTLIDDFNNYISTLNMSIRLAPGRFTITSLLQSVPITVINDFPGTAKVDLVINSLNERVIVRDIKNITVAGKTKVQVMVPIKVLTSGSSALNIIVQNPHGDQIGDPQVYDLSITVISPIATWITTGAAITLFCAALFQSWRRIKRRRKA